MAGSKDLRRRITSVGNIKQITRAMEMVATTKLRRFQDRAIGSRPYTQEITGLLGRLTSSMWEDLRERQMFRPGPAERSLVVVVSSDRGLCGAYNSNVFRVLEEWRAQHPDALYYLYGRKAYQYMSKRGFDIREVIDEPRLEDIDYRAAALAAGVLREEFRSGDFRDVQILYTAFESLVRYVPTMAQFLPLEPAALGVEEDSTCIGDVLLEPDALSIFLRLVPRYLETRLYNALIEALTSEYASRRVAMKNATDAATDMQHVLRGIYNRKRQESITKELLDIVGGAEAIK